MINNSIKRVSEVLVDDEVGKIVAIVDGRLGGGIMWVAKVELELPPNQLRCGFILEGGETFEITEEDFDAFVQREVK